MEREVKSRPEDGTTCKQMSPLDGAHEKQVTVIVTTSELL